MTRINSSTRINGGETPRRVVVLHRQGEQWQVILAENRSGRLHVVEHQSVPVRDADRLSVLIGRLAPDRVVRVLPGGSVLCRVLEIPPLDDAAANQAAWLAAESDLPSLLAEHRRQVVLLPWRTPVDNRLAAAFGWPGERPGDLTASIEALTYTGESAALLELLIHCGASQGTIASLDRDHHSLELASHVNGITTVRTARLSDERWSADAARVMIETALASGADDAALAEIENRASGAARAHRQTLLVDAEVSSRLGRLVSGASSDLAWWNRFGVAVGAALAALGSRRAMVELLDQPPQAPRGAVLSALNWVSDRAHARSVAVFAVLLIVVLPILGGWSRFKILEFKTRRLEEVAAAAKARQAEADFFRTLRRHRWPMTKILADVSGMAPYDLTFDSINIDSTSGVTISGLTTPDRQNDVFEFQGLLNDSRLFSQVKSPNVTSGESKIEFELQATMQEPHGKTTRPYDEPLAVIRHGEEARDVPLGQYNFPLFSLGGGLPRSPSRPARNGSTGSAAAANAFLPGPLGSPSTGTDGSLFPGTTGTPPAEKPLPPPISEAQIAKMDLPAVHKAMIDRAAVKHREPRLLDEYNKLLARRQQLSGAAAGGQP